MNCNIQLFAPPLLPFCLKWETKKTKKTFKCEFSPMVKKRNPKCYWNADTWTPTPLRKQPGVYSINPGIPRRVGEGGGQVHFEIPWLWYNARAFVLSPCVSLWLLLPLGASWSRMTNEVRTGTLGTGQGTAAGKRGKKWPLKS